jgi:hypothetical protein
MLAEPVAPPDRSLEQRMAALRKANEIRIYRSNLKKDLKAGRVAVRPLVENPPAELETMKLVDLLRAVPKFGRAKINKILWRAAASPSKTLSGLSARQREAILELLPPR